MMSLSRLCIGACVACLMASVVEAGEAIPSNELGLSKTSVFDEPTPHSFSYSEGAPGSEQNPDLPLAFPGAPPQIPHDISSFMPLTAKNNQCVTCHNNPAMRGKPKQPGLATPMPESHYTEPAFGKPEAGLAGKVAESVSGSRFVCTQCHAPQADVKPLVNNTF